MANTINRVAVIGSGTMGGALAALCANAGLDVFLLDIVPSKLLPDEEKKGLTLQSPQVRNRIVNAGFDAMKKSRPAALSSPQTAERITIGNLEDHFDFVKRADWIVEVIVENLDIKRQLMARLDAARQPHTIVTTNTSGIPIAAIAAQTSQAFREHFLGTHFFNPPRYLKLLEVIPSQDTLPEVVETMKQFGENILGKGVVVCKDRPNFIANRLGTFIGLYGLRYTLEKGYSFNEIDDLTGPLIGHPKTASFRLLDLVGIDVMLHVAENSYKDLPDDEARAEWQPPEFLREMVKRNWLGNKSAQGIYKQVKTDQGRAFHVLDPKTFEYQPPEKVHSDSAVQAEAIEDLDERLRYWVAQEDRAGKFIWDNTARYLAYASHRVPEIADDIVSIDHAMKWGFANERGPFETWDGLGVAASVERMEQDGFKVAAWVKEMVASGHPSFYKDGQYYDLKSKSYCPLPKNQSAVMLRGQKEILRNDSASLLDLGDGVACLEFHTQTLNALDDNIVEIAAASLAEIDKNFVGMVIGNQGEHFCAGANVMTIGLAAENKEFEKIDAIGKTLQNFLMTIRYSPKPVVTAPFGYTLGGGCEVALAGSRMVASAETYIGLVEVGMGLIPAGGGTKELLRRIVSPVMQTPNVDALPFMQRVFETIALAKVATSATEARDMGFLGASDRVVMNRDYQIAEAKREVLSMVAAGYRPPTRGKIIYAAGERMLAALRIAIFSMLQGKYITEYESKIANKLAYVLCGGNITAPTWVDEQYMLDLERETFISLCGEEKTRERIWHFLSTGKPLRN